MHVKDGYILKRLLSTLPEVPILGCLVTNLGTGQMVDFIHTKAEKHTQETTMS